MRARELGTVALLGAVAISACAGKDAASSDPSRPAVVKAPQVILPSDTAKPDTMPEHRARSTALSSELSVQYATLSASMIMGDRRTLTSFYSPQAQLRFHDSTSSGVTAVANRLIDVARRSGLTTWVRQSRVLTGHPDSIYVDSGIYVMQAKRPGGPGRVDRGTYVSEWRHLGGPVPWVLRRDEISPTVTTDSPSAKTPQKVTTKP